MPIEKQIFNNTNLLFKFDSYSIGLNNRRFDGKNDKILLMEEVKLYARVFERIVAENWNLSLANSRKTLWIYCESELEAGRD